MSICRWKCATGWCAGWWDVEGLPIADAWVTATPERTSAAEAPDHKPAGDRVKEKIGEAIAR